MSRAIFDDWEIDDLLGAVAGQDRAAFAELYRRTSGKLYAITYRILGESTRSDDAVQEAYVRIWRVAASYDAARGRPITWMATIARNIAIDLRRADRARGGARTADIDIDLLPDPAGGSRERVAALGACLDRLEGAQRALIVAAYLGGESREELAERTNRPVGTIKSWLHRGLALLRTCLDG